MQIPQQYNQFSDEKALVIVTGKQTANIYRARNGMFTKARAIRVKTLKYSDREGFFFRGGRGKRYGSGAPRETKDTKSNKEFLRELRSALQKLAKSYKPDAVYLFAPGYAVRDIVASFPAMMKKSLKKKFRGNYTNLHETELIKKLKK